jgi:hypothetical protein
MGPNPTLIYHGLLETYINYKFLLFLFIIHVSFSFLMNSKHFTSHNTLAILG